MNPLEFFTATFCRRDQRKLQTRSINYQVHCEGAKGRRILMIGRIANLESRADERDTVGTGGAYS